MPMTFPTNFPSLLHTSCSATLYLWSPTWYTYILCTPVPYRARVIVHISTCSWSPPTFSGACTVVSTSLQLTACVNPILESHTALCHCVLLSELSSSCLQPSLQPFLIVPVPAVPTHCYPQLTAGVPLMCEPPSSSVIRAATVL
jgi:hypothetical protein